MNRRGRLRKWRLRGRRGQVAAVATILGLLLVVTFIANYLTATLPGQMSTNDLNHIVQVENQVGRLQALLEAASADNAVGGQFTEPITLGSAGQPPFASADSGTVGPTNGTSLALSSSLGGDLVYSPPTGGTPGGIFAPCTLTTGNSVLSCSSFAEVTYNFTGTPAGGFVFQLSAGGTFDLNVSTNGTSTAANEDITVDVSDAAPLDLLVLGSNDTITMAISTGSSVNLTVVGNYDTIDLTNAAVFSTVNVVEVGLHEVTTITGAKDLTYLATIYGTTDTVALPTATTSLNSATGANVYFVGFNPTTTTCPNDNLVISDSVSGGHAPTGGGHPVSYGTYAVTYNVSALPFTPTTAAPAWWTEAANLVTPAAGYCPFFSPTLTTPFGLGNLSSGFTVYLANSYLPSADIAFDQGGVVFAQAGGTPLMLDPPEISGSVTSGDAITSLTLWIPVFLGNFATDSGLSTAEISARLLSLNTIVLTPSSSTLVAPNSDIILTIVTPFATAWTGYFDSTPPFVNEWSCAGPIAACDGPYQPGGPMGTVTLTIPTGTQLTTLNLQIATFAINLI